MGRKFIISFSIFMSSYGLIFADDGAYTTMNKLVKVMLNALSWFGYAIALGALIFLGIKYVMSGAQDRANLKNKFAMYLLGLALIVMCATIASAVAGIANTDGSNTAEGIIEVGESVGNAIIDGVENIQNNTNQSSMPDEFVSIKNEALQNGDGWLTKDKKNAHIIYHIPENAKFDYTDFPGSDPYIEASNNDELTFNSWYVKETNLTDYTEKYYIIQDEKFIFSNSDSTIGYDANKKYEIWGKYD